METSHNPTFVCVCKKRKAAPDSAVVTIGRWVSWLSSGLVVSTGRVQLPSC